MRVHKLKQNRFDVWTFNLQIVIAFSAPVKPGNKGETGETESFSAASRQPESFMPDFGDDGISIDTISGVASFTLLGGLFGLDISPTASKLRLGKLEIETR